MKRSWLLASSACAWVLLLALLNSVHAQSPKMSEQKQAVNQLVNTNLRHLQIDFPARCTTKIKRFIWEQLGKGRRDTERTLGRSALYFPIFEYYLNKYHLPEELKCIPFVESRLKPNAESAVGAKGLWQFMEFTATQYRLKIDEYVDERLDPLRSTEAAVKLLTNLHTEFGDWLLALAAYNCGSGTVHKAMRLASSNNYWDTERYLPKQTQRYIFSYIAAAYVVKYYEQHGLNPKSSRFTFRDLHALKVYHTIDLQLVAQAANLPLYTVRHLNPGYQQEVIPASSRGNYLILPDSLLGEVELAFSQKQIRYEEVQLFGKPNKTKTLLAAFPPVSTNSQPVEAGFDWRFLGSPQNYYFRKFVAFITNPIKFFME